MNSIERKTEAGHEYADPPELGNYIVIDVTYEATEGTPSYSLFDWSVRDSEGREYNKDTSSGYDPKLSTGELTTGTKARGLVVRDAPTGPLTLEYTTGSGAPSTWVVP